MRRNTAWIRWIVKRLSTPSLTPNPDKPYRTIDGFYRRDLTSADAVDILRHLTLTVEDGKPGTGLIYIWHEPEPPFLFIAMGHKYCDDENAVLYLGPNVWRGSDAARIIAECQP